MRKEIHLRIIGCFMIALVDIMLGPCTAFAADTSADPNTDPVLPDPVYNASQQFPPALATAGAADPGSALSSIPMSAETLAGHGPGCSPINPCAVDSPALDKLMPISQPNKPPVRQERPRNKITSIEINGRN